MTRLDLIVRLGSARWIVMTMIIAMMIVMIVSSRFTGIDASRYRLEPNRDRSFVKAAELNAPPPRARRGARVALDLVQ